MRALILLLMLPLAGCITVHVAPPTGAAPFAAAPSADAAGTTDAAPVTPPSVTPPSVTPPPPRSEPREAPRRAGPLRCRDFATRGAAQAAFDANPAGLRHLDGNRDGRVCTSGTGR